MVFKSKRHSSAVVKGSRNRSNEKNSKVVANNASQASPQALENHPPNPEVVSSPRSPSWKVQEIDGACVIPNDTPRSEALKGLLLLERAPNPPKSPAISWPTSPWKVVQEGEVCVIPKDTPRSEALKGLLLLKSAPNVHGTTGSPAADKTPPSSTQGQESSPPGAEGHTRRGLFNENENEDENDLLWDMDDIFPLDSIPEEGEGENENQGTTCRCIWKSLCSTCTPKPQTQAPSARQARKRNLPVLLSFDFLQKRGNEEFKRLTSLTVSQFKQLLDFLDRDTAMRLKYRYDRGTPQKGVEVSSTLTLEDRLLMTLLRLRKGWDVEDMALFFGVALNTASSIIKTWIRFMFYQMQRMKPAMFVSRHLQPKHERPSVFKPFPNFRICIDTTEVRIEVPEDFEEQGNTYSEYKAGNVILFLIGISCWGGVSFVSPGFEGSMSDQEIYKRSGIRDFLEEGDLILADRGFRCEEECDEDNGILLHPPFLGGREKFTPEEEQLTREIASARIFVEHIVRKFKVFHILKKIHNVMLPQLDQMMFIIGFLINLQVQHIL